MKSDDQIYEELKTAVKQDIPKFSAKVKQSSPKMKFLNKFAKLFNPEFMTTYVTTMYPNVYFPLGMNTYLKWTILAHEWVHLRSARKNRFGFTMKYLFPAWLVSLSLLSFLAIWFSKFWLLNLLWLVFAAPLPAVGRMNEELDGYTMSMAIEWWTKRSISLEYISWVSEQFTGPAYYFMWPFKKSMQDKLSARASKIILGHYDTISPYREVKSIILP